MSEAVNASIADLHRRVTKLEEDSLRLSAMLSRFTFAMTQMMMPEEAVKIRAEFIAEHGEEAFDRIAGIPR